MNEASNTGPIVRGRPAAGAAEISGASDASPRSATDPQSGTEPRSSLRDPLRMRRVWLISFFIWSIPAIAFALLVAFAPHERPTESLLTLFLRQGAPWYFWAVLTPLILALPARLVLNGPPRPRFLLTHAFIGGLAGYFFGLVWIVAFMVGSWPNGGEVITYGRLVRTTILFVPFGCGIYATIASIAYAMHFYTRLRERELVASQLQSHLKEAQLGALRMQLQPHFLFNTLNTIAMLVREGETQTSVRMLARLSDLLRHLLEDEGDQEVPLREELDFLGRYLEIEQLRFRDRLRVEVNVEDGTRDAFIPNLVLQPIVENAIQHGIARRAAASSIELRVARENGSLMLSVRDDGPGLSPTFSMDTLTGIGLRNTLARLQFLYGDAASMNVRNAPDQGTIVTLSIPYHEAPVANPNA